MGQFNTSGSLGETETLARFVASLRSEDLPVRVQHECLRALVNGVGCILGGAGHDMVKLASRALLQHEGQEASTLFGQGRRCSLLTAARLNGLAGAAYSFDDTYGEAMLHPSGPILSALFALAETRKVDGTTFLLAYAAGLEVSCRLTKCLTVSPAVPEMAWSQTGIVSGLGAALACGKLLGLAPQQLVWALGNAAIEAGGTRAAHGSMAASLIFGRAAESGLRAALLAEQNFTATPGVIEHPSGFAHVFSRAANLPALTEDLGQKYELLANTYKPYPCGIVIHPAIDAALKLGKGYGLTDQSIAKVEVQANTKAVALANRPDPANDIEAKVSLHHWVAVALFFGRAGLAEGRPEVVANPQIADLRRRIQLSEGTGLSAIAARLALTLQNGATLSQEIQACSGSAARPMTDDELTAKFVQQAETVLGETRATGLSALCWNLPKLSDVAELARAAA